MLMATRAEAAPARGRALAAAAALAGALREDYLGLLPEVRGRPRRARERDAPSRWHSLARVFHAAPPSPRTGSGLTGCGLRAPHAARAPAGPSALESAPERAGARPS